MICCGPVARRSSSPRHWSADGLVISMDVTASDNADDTSTADDTGGSVQAPAGRRSRRVQSVEHAIDILQVLADSGRSMGLSGIAQRVGLSKATVHHLLGTLQARRFVVRDPDTARYRLSWGLYELGAAVVRSVDLTRTARH